MLDSIFMGTNYAFDTTYHEILVVQHELGLILAMRPHLFVL